jgi:Mg-chelatase subunit ChlD
MRIADGAQTGGVLRRFYSSSAAPGVRSASDIRRRFDMHFGRRFGRFARIALVAGLLGATAWAAQVRTPDDLPHHPPGVPPDTSEQTHTIEAVFVLDTTGSMSGLIEGAKQKIWSLANEMAQSSQKTQIRFGLIGYRDRGDSYVTRRFDLTDDLDAISGHLFALTADGGGDTPESVNQALHEAVTQMSWTPGERVYRVVFLVGDAPPHLDYQNDVPYTETVRLATQRDIVLNTVQCGGMAPTTPIWQAIARGAGGVYASIAQDGAMVAVSTPMDDELAELNRELAGTMVAYGGEAEKAELEEKRARAMNAPAPAAASRLAYLAKRGGRANLGRKDLLDALEGGEADLDALPSEALPESMREMAEDERREYIAGRLEKRKELRSAIAGLVSARDEYVRAEQERLDAAGKGDGFDRKVMESVRSQAAAKGIDYAE